MEFVTILNATTMEADALVTAINVLEPVEGYDLAEKYNIPALFIIKVADGFEEKSTSAFPTL
jgi:FAD:protein FMN transferase